jgi:hypothetical protein
LPAAAPIFVVNFGPDGMVRGEVHAKYSFSTPKFKGKVWFMLEFTDWSPSINFGHGTPPGEPEPEPEKPGDNPWGASFEFNGFMQGGMQFPLTLSTNKLLKKILDCEVGTTVYLGPKLSGAISVDLLADNTYDMFKDSKLSLSYFCADYETKAKMKAFWGSDDEVTLADGSFSLLSDIEVYLFPEFEVEVKQPKLTGNQTIAEVTLKPSRNLFMPVLVGAAMFYKGSTKSERMLDCKYTNYQYNTVKMPKYWQFSGDWKKQNSTTLYLGGAKGVFEVRPVFQIAGMQVIGSPAQEIELKGILPDSVFFEPTGGTKTWTIEEDVKDLTYRIINDSQNRGGGVFEVSVEGKTITVKTSNVQHGVLPRQTAVYFEGKRYDEDRKDYIDFHDYFICYQKPDGLYNRFGDGVDGMACQSVKNGNVTTITGHKDAKSPSGTLPPCDGYDINMTIEYIPEYITKASGTIKVIGGLKALHNDKQADFIRETTVISFVDAWIGDPEYDGNAKILCYHSDGNNLTRLYTKYEVTKSYIKFNNDLGQYEIFDEETVNVTDPPYTCPFGLFYKDE